MINRGILILDFGSQYTQLIARRIREMNVYSEVYPYNHVFDKQPDVAGIILSGGPSSTINDNAPSIPDWVFSTKIPLLGICYGMQAMAVQLGGKVESCIAGEFGYAEVLVSAQTPLFDKIYDRVSAQGQSVLDVWMSHGDQVVELPLGFESICTTNTTKIAGMANKDHAWYGLQFHPEVTHTLLGVDILKRFVIDICNASTDWTMDYIIEHSIDEIRKLVGQDQVLLALSGGVDSSVVAALLHRAIGDQLICVFVDTGLLRLNEAQQVMMRFEHHLNLKIHCVNAEDKFYRALEGISCPEQKRKKIGHTFIEVFDEAARLYPAVKWLAQGTIYPDVIESAAVNAKGNTEVIKSHHNVGGLPETMKLHLLEPLRTLFKDEVRHLGLTLGLPKEMVFRHPFPGPGLGVRILGEVKKSYAESLRKADAIFIEELKNAGLYDEVSQAFAVFLPVKSVGVVGDGRRYAHVICLRAVKTIDFMTAEWSQLSWDFLGKVSNRIINEVKDISRVTYDISGKPPATIEWE